MDYFSQTCKFPCFRRKVHPLLDEELKKRIENLEKLILSLRPDGKNIKSVRNRSLRTLLKILQQSSDDQLQLEDPKIIVNCSMKIFTQFDDSFWYIDTCGWKRQKRYQEAKNGYIHLLKIYIPIKCKETVEIVMNHLDNERLWQIEDLCSEIIWQLIENGAHGAIVAHALCDKVEQQITVIENARVIIKTLYELLAVYKWPQTEETVTFIERLLKLYLQSLQNRSNVELEYTVFTRGFELCIRYLIKQASSSLILIFINRMCFWSINENKRNYSILDFGSTLEYAAYMHETDLFENTLTQELFPLVVQMIKSSNRLVSLLGNRVMQYLIDRGENRFLFDTPKIFFQNSRFHLNSRPYRMEDKAFLKKHRQDIHECLLMSVINHCSYRLNLETTYCTICLIAVEIPCGFTAASLACLTMTIQDKIMSHGNFHRESVYHVHVLIISVMSLICWLHQAETFYEYVNKIIMERAQWAPYLNPPIQSRYSFATHHVRWEKPELFFIDWEVRYGLWKRFRDRNSRIVKPE
ncbi:uncharacterized protein LOC122497862 [Leptopilina heterotoma]|uniref:uncharacterized protein LOC122497862 n=1 Tax=Leptopilina heterotoma TaxID=63436 RepID=UPI001CA9A46A|nr:uncharacterized protein LOC122497862 [Leptopilina heterotoma]